MDVGTPYFALTRMQVLVRPGDLALALRGVSFAVTDFDAELLPLKADQGVLLNYAVNAWQLYGGDGAFPHGHLASGSPPPFPTSLDDHHVVGKQIRCERACGCCADSGPAQWLACDHGEDLNCVTGCWAASG